MIGLYRVYIGVIYRGHIGDIYIYVYKSWLTPTPNSELFSVKHLKAVTP